MDNSDSRPKLETTPSPSTEEEKLEPVMEVVLDSEGDLSLLVGAELPGAEPLHFQVCSAALRRASPVWKAMLSGPWAEAAAAQDADDWTIDLPEDNPEALETLLSILHGSFDSVPKVISLDF